MVIKNLIKYTIGLPILLAVSVSLFFMGSLILILEILAVGLGFLIDGELLNLRSLVSIHMMSEGFKIWRPIK